MLNTPLTRNAFVLEGGGLLKFFGDEKSLMCGHIPYSVVIWRAWVGFRGTHVKYFWWGVD